LSESTNEQELEEGKITAVKRSAQEYRLAVLQQAVDQ